MSPKLLKSLSKCISSKKKTWKPRFGIKQNKRKRMETLQQLLLKAEDSVFVMQGALDHYRDPLLELVDKDDDFGGILTKNTVKRIFNAFPLLTTKMRQFANRLRARYQESPHVVVGDIVYDFLTDEQVHLACDSYFENYFVVDSYLYRLFLNHQFLIDFDDLQQRRIGDKLRVKRPVDFRHLNLFPKKIMVEYVVLLGELINKTPKNHPDRVTLTEAKDSIQKVLSWHIFRNLPMRNRKSIPFAPSIEHLN